MTCTWASSSTKKLLPKLAKHDIGYGDLRACLALDNVEAIVRAVEADFAIAFFSSLVAD
jgi:hypothetical protein